MNSNLGETERGSLKDSKINADLSFYLKRETIKIKIDD